MLLFTLPPSGRGVDLSLALDHAPFTRTTPSGTLARVCVLLEKSPPFLGAFDGAPVWLHANETQHAATNEKRRNRECIFLLQVPLVARDFVTLCSSGRNWRDIFLPRQQKVPQNDHNERRKFRMSCCWLGERLTSKLDST